MDKLSLLPEKTVIYFITYELDTENKTYKSVFVITKICEKINLPVFGFFDTLMGAGIIGGNLTSTRAYAREAAKASIEYGFEMLALNEIVSFTAVGNKKSREVMERIGMTLESATFDHPLVPLEHPLRTHCLYKLNRSTWKKTV